MNEATRCLILDGKAGLRLTHELRWTYDDGYATAGVRLRNNQGLWLMLVVKIPLDSPGKMSVLIHDDSKGANNALRLDVRGSHKNKKIDYRSWTKVTHLHLFRDQHADKHAIDPPGWPPHPDWDEDRPVAWDPQEPEIIFSYFRDLCAVASPAEGPAWRAPALELADDDINRTPDGEEIP